MALDCSLLTTDIGACTDTTSKGFAQKAIIGNFSEIATKTVNLTDALVTDLTLAAGKDCYEVIVKGLRPFEDLTIAGVEKKTGMVFNPQIMIYQKGLTPTSSKISKILAEGVFYMILTQLGETGNAKYPAPGIQAGLKATAVEWNAEEGAFVVTLAENMADMPLLFVWKNDLSTTDALVAGLLS